jgi:peptide-methionine (S)-S-oxide reductase
MRNFYSVPLSLAALLLSLGSHAGQDDSAVAVFAGGCFWCTEADFDKLPGVLETTSGYIGGSIENPTYEEVSSGRSGQFCDNGPQYRSAIFYLDAEQQRLAEASKTALAASGRLQQPIATVIQAATTFYAAEDYHQDYHTKNPLRYSYYRHGCGRDQRLQALWGKSE